MEAFLNAHENYDNEKLCVELESIQMYDDEYAEYFSSRFRAICFIFPKRE